jgi:glycosyltransferase involved in cell wall biosynthesis
MTATLALCIPAYNAEATLPRLFASVAAQTEPFDEVWLYDDASTDRTAELATALGATVARGTANVGCSAGKHALLSRIASEWVHFHDADDELLPEFVARAKARIREGGFDALLMDYEQVDEATGAVMSRSDFSGSSLLQDPVRFMLRETVNNGGVYRTELLRRTGGFNLDPEVRYNEDRAFHLRLAEAGARFAVEPYVGCRFHFSRGSMSSANQARCLLSNQAITLRFAQAHPGAYPEEVAAVSWKNAGGLASYLEWEAAEAAVDLAVQCAGRVPAREGALFRAACAVLGGRWALRFREGWIRRTKPHLRIGYPNPTGSSRP